jgi:Tfp pilus assembly protein PilF
MQDYGTALENLDRGIEFKPYNIDYYFLYRGMAKMQLGEPGEAKKDFRTALKFNPENKEIRNRLNASFSFLPLAPADPGGA